MKNSTPPFCYVCKKDYENTVDKLYYCICDTAVCVNCINTVKEKNSWKCPKCSNSNDLEESRLIRPS